MLVGGRVGDLDPEGRPPTLYAAPLTLPHRPALAESIDADVAVIGAGYAGLSAALHLASRGRRVVVLEAARVGAGASGRNGGQVSSGQRLDQATLIETVGADDAARLWAFGEAAKALVREIADGDPDRCDLSEGIIAALVRPGEVDRAREYAALLADRYDYGAVDVLDREAAVAAIGSERFVGGVRDRGAFHLDPYRLVTTLAARGAGAGATIHEWTRASAIAARDGRQVVTTEVGPEVTADAVVVAANGYLGGLVPEIAAHVLPLNNFIAATEPLPADLSRRILSGGEAVYDSRFVIRYWRPTGDRRIVFGGGETTGEGFSGDVAATVRPYLAEIYPELAGVSLTHAWGGTLAITPTRAPFVRRIAPGVYTACGFSGQGVATGTFSGKVLADAIIGDTEAFDVFARLPVPRFPGGTRLRAPLLALALGWYGLRDRLGL